jgi:hypothetical protein
MLSAERRAALLADAMRKNREARATYAQRLVARGGGFRAVTLMSWPVERLAKEVVRLNAENAQDELELLQFLYVEHEPQTQMTFLDAAGVAHENGIIPDELEPPYTDAAGVQRGVDAVLADHGDDGAHYLRTIARYNPAAWPGIDEVVARLP